MNIMRTLDDLKNAIPRGAPKLLSLRAYWWKQKRNRGGWAQLAQRELNQSDRGTEIRMLGESLHVSTRPVKNGSTGKQHGWT